MTIVYTSNTGSTKKYAEALAAKLECECVSFADAGNIDDEVIYMSWVMMGDLQNISEARARFNLKAVIAVGCMSLTEEGQTQVKSKNSITEEFFFLPGTFSIKNLSGMYKMMVKMGINMMKGKVKNSGDPADAEALKKLEEGVDFYDEAKLDPIVEAMK